MHYSCSFVSSFSLFPFAEQLPKESLFVAHFLLLEELIVLASRMRQEEQMDVFKRELVFFKVKQRTIIDKTEFLKKRNSF